MARLPGIGLDDFRARRAAALPYVDKSRFISKVLDDPYAVLLFPRPRRFGKTTNLSMLRYFVERRDEDLRHLFDDLAVWRDAEARAAFGRHPVIFVTFKDVKGDTFDEVLDDVRELIRDVYEEHRYLLDGAALSQEQRQRYHQLLSAAANRSATARALRDLSGHLARHHQQRVFVLIDEYDAPIHHGYLRGFYRQTVDFFRGMYSSVLKSNDTNLLRGVMTGVLRIAHESMLSDLNNLAVRSLRSPEYATCFGFTEPEVRGAIAGTEMAGRLPELRSWYGGYRFAGQEMFNPWSIVNCLHTGRIGDYWRSTGSTELVQRLVAGKKLDLSARFDRLLAGETITQKVLEDLPLTELEERQDAVWGFLVMSGYLTPADSELANGRLPLTIPNREVRRVFQDVFRAWLVERLGESQTADQLCSALLDGDVTAIERMLGAFLETATSYHNGHPRQPETFYHGISLGLSAELEATHHIRSNRESGHGRADILLIPRRPDLPGVVLELKVAEGDDEAAVERAMAAALRQLVDRRYVVELEAAGAAPIRQLALVFYGKRVWARALSGRGDRVP